MSGKVYIVGVGSTALGRFPDKSVKDLTREAVTLALADAGAEHGRYRSRVVLQHASGDDGEPEHHPRPMRAAVDGLRDHPDHQRRECLLLEFHRAQSGLRRNQGRAVRGRTRGRRREDVLSGQEGPDVQGLPRRLGRARHGAHAKDVLLGLGEGLPLPPEAHADTGQHSVFMDIYASLARQHMRLYGTTPRQIAAAAVQEPFPRDHESAGAISHRHVGRRGPRRQADLPGR